MHVCICERNVVLTLKLVLNGLISQPTLDIPEKRKVSIKLRKWIEFHDRSTVCACACARSAEISIYLFKPRVNSHRSETSVPLFIDDGFVSRYTHPHTHIYIYTYIHYSVRTKLVI